MSSPRNLGMVNPRKELEFQQKPQDSSSAWAGIKLFFPVGRSPEFWKKGREKESGILGERKTEPLELPELFGNLIPAGFGRSLKIPLKIPSFQLVFLLPEQLTGNFFPPKSLNFFPLEVIPGFEVFLAHSQKIGFFQIFSMEILVPKLLLQNSKGPGYPWNFWGLRIGSFYSGLGFFLGIKELKETGKKSQRDSQIQGFSSLLLWLEFPWELPEAPGFPGSLFFLGIFGIPVGQNHPRSCGMPGF